MHAGNLTTREQRILSAAVRLHIQTGEPIPSSRVARKLGGLSPASVRTVMARLEEFGFLRQPHTSAGRLPTLKAFDQYAQRLAGQARISARDRDRIDGLMLGKQDKVQDDVEHLLGRVPHTLSEFCGGVGLLIVSPLSHSVLARVRFVGLSRQRVLIVAETRSGLVRDKIVRTREPYDRGELDRMTEYLNDHFQGWTLSAIREEMGRRVQADRSRFLRQAADLCREGFDAEVEPAQLHFEGLARLLGQSDPTDGEALRELLNAVEEKERLVDFLGDCVEGTEPPLRIQVGLRELSPAMQQFVLIGASYGRKGQPLGWLGFLGPTRTNYERAIPGVRYVAGLIDRSLPMN